MPIDRRATIAAALDAAETNNGEVPDDFTPVAVDDDGQVVDPGKNLVQSEGGAEIKTGEDDKLGKGETVNEQVAAPVSPKPGEAPKPGVTEDKPPQSWRAAQKAKWSNVDPEVKEEIHRRERDHERVLSESALARQFAQNFHQVVSPFMARIQALGVHPLTAAQELFKIDHILNHAPMPQRAAMMAQLINNCGVDWQELDKALDATRPAGPDGQRTGGPDPVQQQIAALLDERLRPIQSFLTQQQQQEQARQQALAQQTATTVEQMAADNVKYPHFEAVRQDMADLIEIQSKKGVDLTLEQAYTRAVAMNPEVSQLVQQQQAQVQRQQAAQRQTQRAQRALAASASVTGAPNGAPAGGVVNTKDRRATIEAAFNDLEGR